MAAVAGRGSSAYVAGMKKGSARGRRIGGVPEAILRKMKGMTCRSV
jgi:hypothetical protein